MKKKPDFLLPARERIQQFKDYMDIGESVLEIGTGSGVIARHVLDMGAKHVVAVDINPHSVVQAKKTVPEATVLQSALFSEVTGVFDTIIFAAPWSEGKIEKPIDYALYDYGVVAKFLLELDTYLKPRRLSLVTVLRCLP